MINQIKFTLVVVVLLFSYLITDCAQAATISMSTAKSEYPQFVYYKGNDQMNIALTFDDGPDGYYTAKILDILKEKKVSATFFLVGQKVSAYPDLIKRMVQEGHCVANHSWDHANMSKLTKQKVEDEIKSTESLIQSISGAQTDLFRPPYGAVSQEMLQEVSQMGYKVILWSVDPQDWRGYNSDKVQARILNNVKPGGIVLQHCSNNGTLKSLATLIDKLRAKGYQLVTVPELINDQSAETEREIKLVVNGVEINNSVAPAYASIDNHSMVPLGEVVKALGGKVEFIAGDLYMITINDHLKLAVTKDGKELVVNYAGEPNPNVYILEERAKLKDGNLMMPVRILSKILGLYISWDNNNQTLSINGQIN